MPPTPIEPLMEQLIDGQLFAAQDQEIIEDSQLMRWAYDNMKANGMFDRDCKKWHKKPYADKSWTTCKAFFTVVENDRKKKSPCASNATYTANQVQHVLQQELPSILQQQLEPFDPPAVVPPATTQRQRRGQCK